VWRAVGSGARGLAIALVVAGAFAVFAFDAAFEVFHRLFFSSGSYTFDPRTDRLVQLFPERFWSETAIAVGVVAILVAVLTAWQAGRRAGAARSAPALSTSKVRT
jgi:integral membrane protein (TIGR01906 family)